MMRKNENSISKNVVSLDITWKLGSFFSYFFILISNFLFASSEPISVETATDSSNISANHTPATVIHITEGTIIYGMEHISQGPKISLSSSSKKHKKKAVKAIVQLKKKIQIKIRVSKPAIAVLISKHPSSNTFDVNKHTQDVGTITANNTLKSALHNKIFGFKISSILFYNNSLFTYSFPSIKDITERYSFTRPPPTVI